MKRSLSFCVAVASLMATALPLAADDWPQWRGPRRDGISHETGLLADWPKDGPKLLWRVDDIGGATPLPPSSMTASI